VSKRIKKKLEDKEFFSSITNYDLFNEKVYEEILKLAKINSLLQGSVIVDIGCGCEIWGDKIAEYGYSVVGIDISTNMLKTAHKFAKESNINLSLVCGDAEHMPFRRESFNCAFFGFSLHHITNISLACREASKCVKPGGRITLVEPNGSNPLRIVSNKIGKSLNKIIGNRFSSPAERPLAIKYMHTVFGSIGFRSTQILLHYYVQDYKTDEHLPNLFNLFVKIRNYLFFFTHKLLPRKIGATDFVMIATKKT